MSEKLKCKDCPRCKDNGKIDYFGNHFAICGMGGTMVYPEPRLERHHKEHSDDMTSSHSEEMIYKGCLDLMEKMVEYFHEYMDYIGYDISKEDPDERFSVSFMPTEIVRTLFLSGTGHDGGTSCRMKCKELGIEADKPLKFNFCQEGGEE